MQSTIYWVKTADPPQIKRFILHLPELRALTDLLLLSNLKFYYDLRVCILWRYKLEVAKAAFGFLRTASDDSLSKYSLLTPFLLRREICQVWDWIWSKLAPIETYHFDRWLISIISFPALIVLSRKSTGLQVFAHWLRCTMRTMCVGLLQYNPLLLEAHFASTPSSSTMMA